MMAQPGDQCWQIHRRVLYELRNEIAFPLQIIFEQTIKEKNIRTDWWLENIPAIFKKTVNLMLVVTDQ